MWFGALCVCSIVSVIPAVASLALPAKILCIGFSILYGWVWELEEGTDAWRWLRMSLLVAGCVSVTFSPGLGTVLMLSLLGSIALQKKWQWAVSLKLMLLLLSLAFYGMRL